MRRSMFVLSLIAVLAGTPLRLAEAADDLARSLAESDNSANLEQVDGGVGDDSGASTKPEAFCGALAPAIEQEIPALPCVSSDSLAISEFDRSLDPASICLASPRQKCAWLRRFLC